MLSRRAFLLTIAAAALAAAPAHAQQFDPRSGFSADDARNRRRAGQRLPISQLRAIVRRRFPDCEIINDRIYGDPNGEPVAYQARIVTRDGRLLNVTVDPQTGRVTKVD
jgi:uncharacterized membrane protein YkoI